MEVRWWGAPHALGDSAALRRLDELFPDEKLFTPAEPLTLRVRGVSIREDRDPLFRGDNDLIIVTTYQFGKKPPVSRLQFMKDSVPVGWQGEFFHDIVFSERDFKDKILTITLQVYDMDGVSDGLVDAVRQTAESSAVAFPHLAPYAGAVGFAVPGLLKLIDRLDDHDELLDERIKLEVQPPRTRHRLLQPGYFVCFKKPVGQGYALNRDLRVMSEGGRDEYKDESYAVLQIMREYHDYGGFDVDQRVAKLIGELNGKGQSGKAPLEFLRETLIGYSNFRKLDRAKDLLGKDKRSDAEEELLQELLHDGKLSPYLPS